MLVLEWMVELIPYWSRVFPQKWKCHLLIWFCCILQFLTTFWRKIEGKTMQNYMVKVNSFPLYSGHLAPTARRGKLLTLSSFRVEWVKGRVKAWTLLISLFKIYIRNVGFRVDKIKNTLISCLSQWFFIAWQITKEYNLFII